LKQRNYMHVEAFSQELLTSIRLIEPHLDDFQILYNQLDDQQSKDLLVKVLAFRCLGHRKVKLPLNTPSYWEGLKSVEQMADKSDYIQISFNDWKLYRMNLRSKSLPIELYFTIQGVFTQFILQQYRCVLDYSMIQVDTDDFVIDAGACWGDTSLYFAYKSGPRGKVFSYEFIPSNLEIMRRNLDLNPELSDRVQIVERAVWSESNLPVCYQDNGPGSAVSFDNPMGAEEKVHTLMIDDLVVQNHIPRVDFVKMDIEGAEVSALRGAVQILKKFKPKLAISVYHSLADFVEIPKFIHSLNLDYRFYLRHFSIHTEETILFACPAML